MTNHDDKGPAFLVAWAICSVMIFAVSVGFAGGIKNVFCLPSGGDALSIAVWMLSWGVVAAPFVLLLMRFARKSRK